MKKCENPSCNVETSNPRFCSRKCAAIITNKEVQKKPRKIRLCKKCGKATSSRRSFCDYCRIMGTKISRFTKEQVLTNDTQKYRRIRSNARIIAKRFGILNSCKICGYSLYVEACHIHPISSFGPKVTIGEINSPNNLIGLCPTHHWEFDNGHLKL